MKAQTALKVGDKAPEFEAIDENGNSWKSNDYLGEEFVVVYFYPAAMTGGCTKQACTYRDFQDEFSKLGATVVGVSGDLPEGLQIFQKSTRAKFYLVVRF